MKLEHTTQRVMINRLANRLTHSSDALLYIYGVSIYWGSSYGARRSGTERSC